MSEKKLGFGLMRLPRKGVSIDIEQTAQMVDMFLEAGMTYFDTAYVYPGSEKAIRKALFERYPRESFTIATKLFASVALTENAAKKELQTSLDRLGTNYVDYYLLHSLMASNYRKYEKFHLWDFVNEQKAKGVIRHVGFSYHDGPQLLDQILTEHPEVEFVQLQINYADWENPKVTSRENYEVARKHGKQITIMEPVKGGTLAEPSVDIQRLMKKVRPDMSPASWAIRFAASLDGVLSVLSGMSNVEQMRDNLSYMKDFQTLNEEEMQVIGQIRELLGSSKAIPCTTCRYCTKGCPQQIPIPDVFTAMNKQLVNGRLNEAMNAYQVILDRGNGADSCIACGQCEQVCPQHINIIEQLQNAHTTLTQ